MADKNPNPFAAPKKQADDFEYDDRVKALLFKGYTRAKIARKLKISRSTVVGIVNRLMRDGAF